MTVYIYCIIFLLAILRWFSSMTFSSEMTKNSVNRLYKVEIAVLFSHISIATLQLKCYHVPWVYSGNRKYSRRARTCGGWSRLGRPLLGYVRSGMEGYNANHIPFYKCNFWETTPRHTHGTREHFSCKVATWIGK